MLLTISAEEGEISIDMEEDMDLTEDDFRNVSGQFSGQASIVEVGDAVDVRVETVKVDVSCIIILLFIVGGC